MRKNALKFQVIFMFYLQKNANISPYSESSDFSEQILKFIFFLNLVENTQLTIIFQILCVVLDNPIFLLFLQLPGKKVKDPTIYKQFQTILRNVCLSVISAFCLSSSTSVACLQLTSAYVGA